MEEYAPPEGEVHLEPTEENRPSEQPEVQPVARQQRRKGKERRQEEEEDDFISEEAYSNWKKHYAEKGFIGERGFSQLISPFKELIEQPAEYSWMSGNPTPLTKIGQSLLCTGSSTQGIKHVPTINNDHIGSMCE